MALTIACLSFSAAFAGMLTTLHNFCSTGGTSCSDGVPEAAFPSGLTFDKRGNLYGVAGSDGNANLGGVLFEIPKGGTYKVLYQFCQSLNDVGTCLDGETPETNVVINSAGDILGTTAYGGSGNGGTIFELTTGGVFATLYNFCSDAYPGYCNDGAAPAGNLIIDGAGDLFGTTYSGGTSYSNVNNTNWWYLGTIFEYNIAGSEAVLYSFCTPDDGLVTCSDAYHPLGLSYIGANTGTPYDGAGLLYGATAGGGVNAGGALFRFENGGDRERVLTSFCGNGACSSPSIPQGNVTVISASKMYGTTELGGVSNHGALYEYDGSGRARILHSFCARASCADGSTPSGPVVVDASGNIYGTTIFGGKYQSGTVFEHTTAGKLKVIYSFCAKGGAGICTDGAEPEGPLTYTAAARGRAYDGAAALYGMTISGGKHFKGTVFAVKP